MATVRPTLNELAVIAVEHVGGCLALAWEPGRIPQPTGWPLCFRFVHVIFRFRREAVAFHEALERRNFTRMGRQAIRERTVHDEQGMLRGWAATAIVSPHYEAPIGLHVIGIPAGRQPGCAVQARLRQERMEAELRREARAARQETREPTDRLVEHFDLLVPDADDDEAFDERLADRLVEADLARLERELDALYARRPGYFPTVAALYAYTERKRQQKQRVTVAELDTAARTVVIELHNQAVEAARPKGPNRQAALERDAAEVAQAARRPRRRRRLGAAEELELLELQVALRRKGLLPALSATEAVAEAQALAALRARVAG
jgi:hypothetical protein